MANFEKLTIIKYLIVTSPNKTTTATTRHNVVACGGTNHSYRSGCSMRILFHQQICPPRCARTDYHT